MQKAWNCVCAVETENSCYVPVSYTHLDVYKRQVFKYNYQTDFYHTDSVHRAYAINDEKGMVIATWPKGGRPKFPLSYAGEVWTGVEYSVAANLIYLGCVEEGLTIVKSIRCLLYTSRCV